MMITVDHTGDNFKGSFMAGITGGNESNTSLVLLLTQGMHVNNTLTQESVDGDEMCIQFFGTHEIIGFLTLMKLAINAYEKKSGQTL